MITLMVAFLTLCILKISSDDKSFIFNKINSKLKLLLVKYIIVSSIEDVNIGLILYSDIIENNEIRSCTSL